MIDQRVEKGPRTTGAEGHQKDQYRRRAPLPTESRTYELPKVRPSANVQGIINLFRFDELIGHITSAGDHGATPPYQEWDADEEPLPRQRRFLIEHFRTLYRKQVVNNGALETTYPRMTQIFVAKRSLCVVLIHQSLAPCEVVLKAVSRKAVYPARKTRQYPHSKQLRFSLRPPAR